MSVVPQTGNGLLEAERAFDDVFLVEACEPLDVWPRENLDVSVLADQNYVLDEQAFNAVQIAVRAEFAEAHYYIRLLEAPADVPIHYLARWDDGPLHEIDGTPVLRNGIYSPTRRWGIYFSEVDVAVIGGTPEVLQRVAAVLETAFEEQIQRVVADARSTFGSDPPSFLEPLVVRLLGRDVGRSRLAAAGFQLGGNA